MAVSHSKLASLLQKAGDRARALGAFREGRAIMARMVALSPDNAEWKRDLAWFEGQVAAWER